MASTQGEPLTKAAYLAKVRRDKLQDMAVNLVIDLKRDCKTTNALGRRMLTWGAMLPAVIPGSDEDLDEVLNMFAENLQAGFTKVEWCKAAVATEWLQKPVRFGSHIHLRAHWGEDGGEYFD
mmetsp:Transcript_37727/g.59718  ORF Transcript_37727/g.59718 Transcript_37727/m.59718 type:complete len:122 (+) Transcript_37727:64-429(+)|eukprot:CAMPEP_0169109230 /NCGR_PEP_ID=MMETSP1015-20121227/25854_1 /TAXON_ID=342587 /ORGANISM="Karlodinium micrum, Strain CCMP2283" /LENGTH=121 /DNA_ID=CAMNT_0009170913 /DNA_START=57 /DNA_END=422 /DNA_ORIENTATION=+